MKLNNILLWSGEGHFGRFCPPSKQLSDVIPLIELEDLGSRLPLSLAGEVRDGGYLLQAGWFNRGREEGGVDKGGKRGGGREERTAPRNTSYRHIGEHLSPNFVWTVRYA